MTLAASDPVTYAQVVCVTAVRLPQLLLLHSSSDIQKSASTFFMQLIGTLDGPLLPKPHCRYNSVVLYIRSLNLALIVLCIHTGCSHKATKIEKNTGRHALLK